MSFPIRHRGARISLTTTAPEGWDPAETTLETTLGGSVSSGSSMTSRTAARLAWGIAILSYAIVAACLVLLWLNRATIRSVGAGPVGNLVPAATLGALGALIASRRPSNAIGWLMLFIAPLVGISALAALISIHALLAGVSPHGWVRWTAWVQNWIGSPPLGALILIFLLFPDGRLLSRRWRWVARLTVLGSAWFVAGAVLDAAPVELSPHLPKVGNPVGVPALAGFSNGPAFLVIVVLIVVAMASLFLRLRRSMGEQRQQLKWFAYAAGVSVGLLILAIPATSLSPALSNAMFTVAFSLGFAFLVPAAAALAILRYGLYEVDVVINKTILYFSLAAVITAIYAGIVVGIGAIIGSKGNVVLSVLATAIVAIAFQPIRDRSRRFANRLVYGKRATPYEVLSEFADRMAGTYSVEDVLPRTARILGEATGAVRADVWLRVGAELHATGSWPSAPEGGRVPFADTEATEVPGASCVVVVRHQGESLGALSVQKAPNSSSSHWPSRRDWPTPWSGAMSRRRMRCWPRYRRRRRMPWRTCGSSPGGSTLRSSPTRAWPSPCRLRPAGRRSPSPWRRRGSPATGRTRRRRSTSACSRACRTWRSTRARRTPWFACLRPIVPFRSRSPMTARGSIPAAHRM